MALATRREKEASENHQEKSGAQGFLVGGTARSARAGKRPCCAARNAVRVYLFAIAASSESERARRTESSEGTPKGSQERRGNVFRGQVYLTNAVAPVFSNRFTQNFRLPARHHCALSSPSIFTPSLVRSLNTLSRFIGIPWLRRSASAPT